MESLLQQLPLHEIPDIEPVSLIPGDGRQPAKARIMHLVGTTNVSPPNERWQQPSVPDQLAADPEECQMLSKNKLSNLCWISTNATVEIRAITVEYHQSLQSKPLSQREMEVLRLIVEGDTNAEIAKKLYLTAGTVKSHVRNIFAKLGVRDRTLAAVFALRAGLID